MRFRKNAVAITSDVEQMFYQFRVTENHRDYIRFFWYRDNDFSKPLIEYRMTSHVFGNNVIKITDTRSILINTNNLLFRGTL